MKRKLIYAIIFISIFLMSSASMVSPVQGYEPPDIPAEAKGMTLDDTEVTVYDEEEMENCLGKGFDIKDIKAGDADVVGARSQMKILDWETDEDLLDYEKVWVYEAVEFESSAETIRGTFWALSNRTPNPALPPLGPLLMMVSPASGDGTLSTLAGIYNTTVDGSILPWDTLMANSLYAKEYDGTILEREIWDFLDPAEEFDPNKPDVDDDEVPYMLDPRDWRDSYTQVRNLRNYITGRADTIQAALDAWYQRIAYGPGSWVNVNATLAGIAGLNDTLISIVPTDMPLAVWILGSYIHQNVKLSTYYSVPDKFGYLLQLLEAGQPCASPAADFIKRAVKEFNIREGPYKIPFISYGDDWLGLLGAPGAPGSGIGDGDVSPIPRNTLYFAKWTPLINFSMGGETEYVYADVDVKVDDAGTVEVSIEYLDDQLDPKDIIENEFLYRYVHGNDYEDDPDELDDWEWIFPKGAEGDTIMKSGDTQFYVTHPMEGPIPGYEIPVLIGVSLVSVIGLIYVVMKKRKK